jgi:hexosaminidase
MPINFIKKTIDLMALYKLNTFHWHLTDGAGWRLQIFKYPELTSKAAFRTNNSWKDWAKNGRKYLSEGAPNAYGGYYTQEEAKAMVAYAAKRGITIIPEIEMPGHSEEVTAVYPNLACSGLPYTQSEFCIGNDSTFIFLQDVLTEVMQVFPSKYIHIGGDEADKKAWKTCPKCQARIKNEHLKDEHELQSYAIRRMEKFLTAHGRKLLGWDEILEGGLAPAATVMSWRGEAGGIAAAKAGHDVIMTPGSHCYFDAYQADPSTQPDAIGGFLPLSKVYSYEPIPAELTAAEAKYVLGAQANVWTEYMPTMEHVEYMVFPRLLALSEVLWSGKEAKNWDDFQQRLQQQYTLLQRKGVNYYRPIPNLEIKTFADTIKKASLVTIVSEQYRPDIRYTLNGGEPDSNSTHYDKPFLVKGMEMVKAAIFDKATNKMGPITNKQTVYHKAVGAKITYNLPYNNRYAAQGNYTLLNGQQGGYSYNDGQWQGFLNDLDVTIELAQLTDVSKVSVNFMQLIGPGVYMPKNVVYSWSANGKDYDAPVQVENTVPDTETKLVVKPFETTVNKPIKYIHIKADNYKHGFLFADEILVN